METSELCQFRSECLQFLDYQERNQKNVHGCCVQTTYCGREGTRGIQLYKDRIYKDKVEHQRELPKG